MMCLSSRRRERRSAEREREGRATLLTAAPTPRASLHELVISVNHPEEPFEPGAVTTPV